MRPIKLINCFWLAVLLMEPALGHDDPSTSVSALSQHIQEEPDNPALYVRRGEQYRLAKAWPEALQDFERAAELVDDPVEIDGALGESLLRTGNAEAALEHLDRFIERYPDNNEALEVRGDAYVALSEYADAATDYTKALEQTTRPKPGIYLKLTRAYAAEERYEEALQTVDDGVQKLGPAISLLQEGINLEVQREAYDAALQRINQLPGRLRDTPLWLIRKGDIFRLDGQEKAALESYELAQERYEALPSVRKKLPAAEKISEMLEERLPTA